MATYRWDGHEETLTVSGLEFREDQLKARVNGEVIALHVVQDSCGRVLLNGDSVRTADAAVDGDHVWIQYQGVTWRLDRIDELDQEAADETGDGAVLAPMPGKILELLFDCGAIVEAGDVLVRMESMKLQLDVRAPRSGVLSECRVAVGDMVNGGDRLIQIEEQE